MKRDQIVPRDVLDGVGVPQRRVVQRMSDRIHVGEERLLRHFEGIFISPLLGREQLGPYLLDLFRWERRREELFRGQVQEHGQIAFQRLPRDVRHLLPGAESQLRRGEIQRLLNLLPGMLLRAAGQHLRRESRQPGLPRRVEYRPRHHVAVHDDERRRAVFLQNHLHPIRQPDLPRPVAPGSPPPPAPRRSRRNRPACSASPSPAPAPARRSRRSSRSPPTIPPCGSPARSTCAPPAEYLAR